MSKNKTTERKEIREVLDIIDLDNFVSTEGYSSEIPFDSFVEKLNDLLDGYKNNGYSNITLGVNSSTDDYYGETYTNLYIQGSRKETEEEYKTRLERNRKANETRRKNKEKKEALENDPEYQEFKRLEEKFKGGNG